MSADPKIFGIGLSKTGTSSLCEALRILGYSVVDFPKRPEQIDGHEAATDTSVSCRFEELDRLYPGSRFIYTLREREAWLRSCERFWRLHKRTIAEQAILRQVFTALYGAPEFERARFAAAYARHERRVLEYFAGRPGDLLFLDICRRPSWGPLCDFLGKPPPAVAFPRSNTFAQARRREHRHRIWRAVKPVVPKPIRRLVKPS